ncbi:MAG: PAS domain S-box protein, partial [Leptospiraceae bacterium]|nr:PAS domain S-box protein [Leptospiraceae bacterium]
MNSRILIHKKLRQLKAQNKQLQSEIAFRTQLEKVLREKETRLHAIYNSASVAIGIIDTNGNWLDANQYWLELLGYSKEEFLNLSNRSITHPDDMEITLQYMKNILNGIIKIHRFEKRYLKKNGEIIWMDISISPLLDETGKVIALIGAGTNITERIRAEEALRRSETLFRAIIEQSGEGISLADSTGR